MSVLLKTDITQNEKLRLKALELSERLTKSTIAAGITRKQLERDAYKAFLDIKRTRRFGRS